ncbi:IPT/TIG domain-containing protein [Clostridium sp. Cult2]|uniref:IPT/TIG domain-containing protein n=1 Tax=Clostridium sp. Cult2 TaxID=2079003 RepID=UPI001F21320F|nr:IPT/TIG domain-containing protein [Clostridium sp. Cult2]
MDKLKRTLSFLLILSIILPFFPLGMRKAYAYDEKGFRVNHVTLYKIYNRDRHMEERRILIRGRSLKDAPVGIITNKELKMLTRPTINTENILQFDLKEDEVGDTLVIGSAEIQLDEGLMPTLSQVSRKVESKNGTLALKGSNFDQIDGLNVKAYHEYMGNPIEIPYSHFSNPTEAQINGLTGSLGLQDIVFKKETTKKYYFNENNPDVDVNISIIYTYKDQFNLYQKIEVDELEMRPTRGVAGETVFFEAPYIVGTKNLEEYDVFFLKDIDGTDYYREENKGKNRTFQTQVIKGEKEYNVLTIEVPNLPLGEYYVVLTNTVDGKDPMKYVTQEKVLEQRFTIVDGSIKSKILDLQPNKGPDTGSITTITGQFFVTLNIAEFTPDDEESLKIITDTEARNPKTLTVSYGSGTYGEETNPINIIKAERTIKVIIGGEATFLTKEDGKDFDVSFSKDLDSMTVRTAQVTDGDTSPVKDVVVETTTTLYKDGGETIVIRERAELKRGYTYILSKVKPTINAIVPDKIQVVEANGEYEIPEDRMVAIHGQNFMVHKYIDDKGKEIVRYPRIYIGEITLDKNTNSELDIKVLDNRGNKLDGTQNNELGNKILIILPKGSKVTNLGKADVVVQNPIRNSTALGLLERKTDFVEFVAPTEDENPVITNVHPDTSPIDGGELITIEGANFQLGVKVFIDGEEVKNINRREDGKQITFTAPAGREGETQLQVMNPKGGMDTKPFFYVSTFTNPKIIDFNPKRGNTGTIVTIKGENFLKPDPIATAQNPYRLIGTRVLLGNMELNEYNRNSTTKRIEVEEFEPKEKLFQIHGETIKVADYYHGLLLRTEEGKFYTVDIKPNGEIILSDGGVNTYTIELRDGKIVANKQGGHIHPIDVETNLITIYQPNSTTPVVELKHASLYKIENGNIVGNRVKVIDRNTIYFEVPILGTPGFYDLSVINPDTKKDSRVGRQGFEYITQPDLKPKITRIHPNEGSVEGGYAIDIIGEDFETSEGNKPKVYINGVEVPANDREVSIDGKTITVIVPKYDGDLREDKGTNRWPVPVVVLNPDGSTASKEDGFYYVVPSSNPRIQKIVPTSGTAAGGDIVEITGFDFRFFEPYDDKNRNQMKDEDEKYNDLNDNGVWDDLINIPDGYTEEEIDQLKGKTPIDHQRFSHYYNSPILPKIYIGDKQAKIVEFSRGYIKVIAPGGNPGKTNVYLVNNDGGISNKVAFTYEATQVKIDSIVPNEGRRQGGDRIEIHGNGFAATEIEVYQDNIKDDKSQFIEKNMATVKFGNITNKDIPRDRENSGRIDQKRARVKLPGGLTAEFNGVVEKIVLTIEEGDKIYKKEILGYDNTTKYIPVSLLKNGSTPYPGKELIKVSIEDRRFIVERGFSENVNYLSSIQLRVETPTYYTVGKVPLFVINPDGGEGRGEFEYKTPDSKPAITNITRNGRNPKEEYKEEINGRARVLKVDHKGGSIITVHGTDFREGAKINISNILTIGENHIDYGLPTKLTFTIPPVPESEVGKLHGVTVTNRDGGVATSERSIPPIFIEFTKGESNPEIYTIEPEKGSATGGTKVKITGNDFRQTMEGFEGERLRVYFGDEEVESRHIKFIDYKTLEITSPKSNILGSVQVRIENPDGSMSQGDIIFTYISKPKIATISPNKIFTNDTETEVTLTGQMFLPGANVIVGGKIINKNEIKEGIDIKGEGIIGVDNQGKNREVAVVGGIEAASVTVEGNNIIKVKFQEGKDLENTNLIIINPDGGISDPYDKFEYQIPLPTKPLVLEGIPGYESTVQLIWSKSDENILNKATRYEIYGRLSKDKDYTFIGDTTEAEFLVKGLEPKTEYTFMVRALNEYGGALDFATVKVKTLTLREDEKLKEKDEELNKKEKEIEQKGKEEIIEGRVIQIIGSNHLRGRVIDFSLAKYKSYDKFTVSIPIEYARKDKNLTIKDGTMTTIINIRDLYTLEVSKKDKGNKDAYINIHIERTKEPHIPRGKRVASKAYNIDFDYQYGKNKIEINNLLRPAKLMLKQDTITYSNTKDTKLYRFNPPTGNYISTGGTSTDIKGKGKYILLSNR